MKEYKGLKVPEKVNEDKISINDIQELHCNSSDCGTKLQCRDCLFGIKNLEAFKQWYKEKDNGND